MTVAGPTREGDWWRTSVGYEVYLRSFADSDGDGIGDLPGLEGHLDYLSWLGVDLVWVTPFYPSPMADHGYDVADYCDVDPDYGQLDDVDRLVRGANERGLRVLVDLVPNHTSSEHPWFKEARSSRSSPWRDYYIWEDPAPDGGPPNNWRSHFGGPAWTYDHTTGQYWCHLFLPEQPDLNWANPAVADEFDRILRFWLDRGVDGFRIDVAHALMKHPELRDNPPRQNPDPAGEPGLIGQYSEFDHTYDLNQPEVLDIYRRWRAVAEPYGALLLGEVYLLDIAKLAPYVADQDGLHLSFWFKPLYVDWDPAAVREVLAQATAAVPGYVGWIQGSHDQPRAVTRFGGGDRGRARALAFATLLMGLPGVPFVYQGEELGLGDVHIPPDRVQDPGALRQGGTGRDGCRTPMPWEPEPGLGFTTAPDAWLPFGHRPDSETVAVQRQDPGSTLHRYRRLIHLRRQTPALHDRRVEWLAEQGPVVAYRRGPVVVAANCGETPHAAPLPEGSWDTAFATDPGREETKVETELELAPTEAVVLTLREPSS